MKRAIAAALLLALAGCTSSTPYGECIGAFDQERPELVYKPSVRNIVVGILFFELIVPPVVVLVDEIKCPVGKR